MNTAEFTSKYYIDRRGSHSRKWDGQHLKFSRTDLLPLWVADMDFMPPQCIQEAICNYVKANPLGYTMINPNYIDGINAVTIVIFKKIGLQAPPMSLPVLCGVLGLSQNQTIPSPF